MSTTTVAVALQMAATEELTATEQPNASSAAERRLTCNALNLSTTLTSTTVPKVDKAPIYRKHTFTSGVKITIDLTAAPGLKSPDSVTRAVDLTAAKLKHLLIRCGGSNNAAGVTIGEGALNPYPLFGAAKSVILKPGTVLGLGFNAVESSLPAVAAAVKEIDITPGASGDVVEIEMAFGT